MSTAPGNLIFNARRPLQEQPFNTTNTVDANSKITETPVNRKSVTKLTTPPESTLSRKKGLSFETPIKNTTDTDKFDTKLETNIDSALLSPAFSSPRNTKPYRTASSPPPACINPSSSLSLPDDFKPTLTVPNPTPAVTKKKKSKKESKEAAFDLDSEEKPPYSYATLIGISILSHEDKRLPLSQIYQWISDTFKYYKREDVGWQNSIRHNLSLNKAFVKGEKSKDGKGHFWCIKPGFEEQFLKSRSVKKSSYHEVMDQINSANLNKLKNKEETKRSMNAIPSSPNSSDIKTFKAPPNYHYNTTKTNKKKRSYKYSDDESSDDYSYDYTKADEEDEEENTEGSKKQRTDKLGEPFGPWPEDSQLNLNTPQFIITESPVKPLLAGKNLTYTSSFSCNSNLELSPIRPSETGPLLEPITPANNAYQNPAQHIHNHSILHHHLLQRPSSTSSSSLLNHPLNTTSTTPNILQRTPKSNTIRTPLRNLRTPQTNSIMKRLWNSPSYLDEFYYSPLVSSHSLLQHQTSMNGLLNSYDDDDMIMRNFENHPHHHQSPVLSKKSGSSSSLTSTVADSSRNLFNDFKNVSASSVSSDEPESGKTAHSRQVSSSSTEADEN